MGPSIGTGELVVIFGICTLCCMGVLVLAGVVAGIVYLVRGKKQPDLPPPESVQSEVIPPPS